MSDTTQITLSQDIAAILVPQGMPVRFPSGTIITLSNPLGDYVTGQINGQLSRIKINHLEKEIAEQFLPKSATDAPEVTINNLLSPKNKEQVTEEIWNLLRECYDPEIPVNIVDLGLIYQVHFESEHGAVTITMTLTAPGCGMGPVLVDDVKQKVFQIPEVNSVEVDMVFEPPWNQEMMSEAAKLELGLL